MRHFSEISKIKNTKTNKKKIPSSFSENVTLNKDISFLA